MKLTPNAVRTAIVPPGKTEAIYFDDTIPGFGLRLRDQGSRTFVFQYKLGTKQRRMALGSATALNLTAVRKTAEQLHARVRLGQDPASDKVEAKRQVAETFASVLDRYLDYKRKLLRPRSMLEVERHLTSHAKPLHQLNLAKIERRDIATVRAAISSSSGDVTANRVRDSLSGFFAWTMCRRSAPRISASMLFRSRRPP
jgi:hypothetical protein